MEYGEHEVPVDHVISSLRVDFDSRVASGDRLGRVRVWEPYGRGITTDAFDFPAPISALAAADGRLFVAHGEGLTAVPLGRR